MIISFDEQGEFENAENTDKPIFIAGLMYDEGVGRDLINEKVRIKQYYKQVIKDAGDGEGFIYPQALHSNSNSYRDHEIIAPVKQKVKATLEEFFKDGTYNCEQLLDESGIKLKPREGKYYLFAVLKSRAGMKYLLNNSADLLTRDDKAGNLYYHMVNRAIHRLVFNNPIVDISDIKLYLPTRSTANLDNQTEIAKELKQNRYPINEVGENLGFYRLTNADVFRTILQQEYINSEKTSQISVSEFVVRSINYSNSYNMEFYYLADSICSILGYQLNADEQGEYLENIENRLVDLIGVDNTIIIGYDELEKEFSLSLKMVNDNRYYDALENIWESKQKTSKFLTYYNKTWFNNIENRIKNTSSIDAFKNIIDGLEKIIKSNYLNKEMARYIYDVATKMLNNISFKNYEEEKYLYQFYDIGVSLYCHEGKSNKAIELFNKCTEYADRVGLEAYYRSRNKLVESLLDLFDYEQAIQIANSNIEYHDFLNELRKDIHEKIGTKLPEEESVNFNYAMAYSQKGRTLAFMGDKEAQREFNMALSLFEKKSDNYKITQSFYLHYLIDAGLKDEYEYQMKDYCDGASSLTEQLQFILREGVKKNPIIHITYALYVFIKGTATFNIDKVSGYVWSTIKNLENNVRKKIKNENWKLSVYPGGLVYKYIYIIATHKRDNNLKEYSLNKVSEGTAIDYSIIKVINMIALAECLNLKNDIEKRDELTTSIYKILIRDFPALKVKEYVESGDERYKDIISILRYMHK